MVSDFILPCGRLELAPHILDMEIPPILQNRNPTPVVGISINRRQATEYIKVGNGSWWKGEDLMRHTLEVAIPIFETSFPKAQGLFLFDHATSHTADALDALRAFKLNMEPGGKQPYLRDGWFYGPDGCTVYPQKMQFDINDLSVPEDWRGKPKGVRQILEERGLYPFHGVYLRHDCSTQKKKSQRQHVGHSCCARQLLSCQPDFKNQKCRLHEAIEERGHICLFFPKFHCEINWIEYRWGRAKWYTRKNCKYTWPALVKIVPDALSNVPPLLLLKFWWKINRIIHAYQHGVKYGTKKFTETVYKSHRRISMAQELD
jgi:hypothetical protein